MVKEFIDSIDDDGDSLVARIERAVDSVRALPWHGPRRASVVDAAIPRD